MALIFSGTPLNRFFLAVVAQQFSRTRNIMFKRRLNSNFANVNKQICDLPFLGTHFRGLFNNAPSAR